MKKNLFVVAFLLTCSALLVCCRKNTGQLMIGRWKYARTIADTAANDPFVKSAMSMIMIESFAQLHTTEYFGDSTYRLLSTIDNRETERGKYWLENEDKTLVFAGENSVMSWKCEIVFIDEDSMAVKNSGLTTVFLKVKK